MALNVPFQSCMKNLVDDTVARLLELQSLEERLEEFRRDHEKCADVLALIESLRANLPVTALINHDRMHKQGKASVAAVRHGVCSGCHLTLAVGNVHALRAGTLHRCGNCGRYLYLGQEEDEERATTVAAVKQKTPATKSPVTSDADRAEQRANHRAHAGRLPKAIAPSGPRRS